MVMMRRTRRHSSLSSFVVIVVVAVFQLLLVSTTTTAQQVKSTTQPQQATTTSTTTASTTTTPTVEELQLMSDMELEAICTKLGFKVMNEDPDTGVPIDQTHEHYVEAARQCLEIQSEMEQILQEHPELQKEYEEALEQLIAEETKERDRLLKEVNDLEAEVATHETSSNKDEQEEEEEEEPDQVVEEETAATNSNNDHDGEKVTLEESTAIPNNDEPQQQHQEEEEEEQIIDDTTTTPTTTESSSSSSSSTSSSLSIPNPEMMNKKELVAAYAKQLHQTCMQLWMKHIAPPLLAVWTQQIQPRIVLLVNRLIPQVHQEQILKYYRMAILPLMQHLQQIGRKGWKLLIVGMEQLQIQMQRLQEEIEKRKSSSTTPSNDDDDDKNE